MNRASLYFHTLRHLKWVQIYGRLHYRLHQPKLDLRPAPSVRGSLKIWVIPSRRLPSLLSPTSCRFLNEEHAIADPQIWNDPAREKLWLYNLHYFDDLNAVQATERSAWHRALIARWIAENPPAIGVGWEPYPLSLRIVNWIKWASSGQDMEAAWLQSLAIQTRFLSQRLEQHLLGNHLFANAKALVFAGLFFAGEEAQRWLNTGLKILAREIPEQILADGGQFERSTMYHALALEDVLDLLNITRIHADAIPPHWHPFVASWADLAERMQRWLAVMCHPDGEISFFNDAAIGIAPTLAELERYGRDLGVVASSESGDNMVHLAESGYIRVHEHELVALIDVAPIGPDYLPGHAHADTLSFELSLFGQRVFVNSGTSCYGKSTERLRQRGTAAHNTVVVDGQDSSEVWSGFRVARRARPFDLDINKVGGQLHISCAHDGYKRLGGQAVHHRTWEFGEKSLVVEDRIAGTYKQATARFHLHPAVQVEEFLDADGAAAVVLKLPHGQKMLLSVTGGRLRQEAAVWHPEFGRDEATLCLVADFADSVLCTNIRWDSAV